MAELMYTGDIGASNITSVMGIHSGIKHVMSGSHDKFQKVLEASKVTKVLDDILAPLERASFNLIEGAPGIGKSVSLNEIAYRWANKELLQKFELVLLVSLRDPSLQKIKSVDNLLQLFYKGDENTEIILSACSEYLSKNGGESRTLLLDGGYDEYPNNLQKSSLITDI